MTAQPSELCHNAHGVQEKWSLDDNSCRASTSRGLSHSSGDFDGSKSISFCSDKCSCESRNMYFQDCCEVPCMIRSISEIHRKKWNIFKKTYDFFLKIRKSKKVNKSEGKTAQLVKEIVEPEKNV